VDSIQTTHKFIPISEFNDLARARKFKEGPFKDSFGDGYGEPYNPNRAVWGVLEDGTAVRSRIGRETDD